MRDLTQRHTHEKLLVFAIKLV